MIQKKIVVNDLLYHPAHGLCRVERLTEQNRSGKKVPCYSLVPRTKTPMKVRFEITASEVAVSGFHHVITAKEAQKVLNYLKTGDSSGTQTHQTWLRAQNILAFSEDKTNARDQRKRKLLESSIKGLVGELSCALNLSVKDTVSRIEKSLSPGVKSDTLVIAALDRAAEED